MRKCFLFVTFALLSVSLLAAKCKHCSQLCEYEYDVKFCGACGAYPWGLTPLKISLGGESGLFCWDQSIIAGIDLTLLVSDNISLYGLGVAGILNMAQEGEVIGVQVSGVGNLGGRNSCSIQIAGWVNFVKRESLGLQIGACNGTEKHFAGIQLGAFNFTEKASFGIQVGAINFTEKYSSGIQVGAFNYTKSGFGGVQLGVLNIAKARYKGIQIGILNWNDENDLLLPGVNMSF